MQLLQAIHGQPEGCSDPAGGFKTFAASRRRVFASGTRAWVNSAYLLACAQEAICSTLAGFAFCDSVT